MESLLLQSQQSTPSSTPTSSPIRQRTASKTPQMHARASFSSPNKTPENTTQNPLESLTSTHFHSHLRHLGRPYYSTITSHRLELRRNKEDLNAKFVIDLEGCAVGIARGNVDVTEQEWVVVEPLQRDDQQLFFLLDSNGKVWHFQAMEHSRVQWIIALRIEIEWAHRLRQRDAHLEFGLLSAGVIESSQGDLSGTVLFSSGEESETPPMSNDSSGSLHAPQSPPIRVQCPILQEAVKNNLWFLSLKAQESNFNKTNDLHIQSVIKNFEKDKERELSQLQLKYEKELQQKENHLRKNFERTLNMERAKWTQEVDMLNRRVQEVTDLMTQQEVQLKRQHLDVLHEQKRVLRQEHSQEVQRLRSLIDEYRERAAHLDTQLDVTKHELESLQLKVGAQNIESILLENAQLREQLFNMNRDFTEQRYVFEKRIRKMEYESSSVLENTIHHMENNHRLKMADLKFSLLKELQEKEVNMTLALSQQRCAMESKLIKLKFGYDLDQDDFAKHVEGNFFSGDALKVAQVEIESLTQEKKTLVEKISALEAQHEKIFADFQKSVRQDESAAISREHEEQWLRHVSQVFEEARKDANSLKSIIAQQKEQITALQSDISLLKSNTEQTVSKRLRELREELEEKHRAEIQQLRVEKHAALELMREKRELDSEWVNYDSVKDDQSTATTHAPQVKGQHSP